MSAKQEFESFCLTVTVMVFGLMCGSSSQKCLSGSYRVWNYWGVHLINCVALCSPYRAGIDDVETDVVEIEAKLDKVC